MGRPIDTAYNYEQQLSEAGFVNIHVIREKWPLNRWPRDKKYKQLGKYYSFRLHLSFSGLLKIRSFVLLCLSTSPLVIGGYADLQIGIWGQENCLSGLAAFSLAVFTRPRSENGLGWSNEELEVLLAGVRKDLKNTAIHAYFPV